MHEGHRKRLYSRLENGDPLYDHEILEILLFNALPRVNTNPIAHALIDRFCTLSNVLNADVSELKTVEGVGEQTAYYLNIVGQCLRRSGKAEGIARLTNLGECKTFVAMRLNGKFDEFLEMYFIEKNGLVKRIFSYTSSDSNRVSLSGEAVAQNIAAGKPYGLLIAHNHLNGSSRPSEKDMEFTKRIQWICSLNHVVLYDHIIYASDDNMYSFNDSGALDAIRRECSFKI